MSKYIRSFPNTLVAANDKPVISPALSKMIVDAAVNDVMSKSPLAMSGRAILAAQAAIHVEAGLARFERKELPSFLKHLENEKTLDKEPTFV